jgi:ribonuclease BN (tRNA processing enzyme)
MARAPSLKRRGLLGLAAATGLASTLPSHAADNAPPPQAPPLELLVLGSGGPGAVGRAGSCFVILVDGKPRILLDAGGGAFARLGEEKLPLHGMDIVLLTHLHVDHAAELPAIFKARAVSGGGPERFRIFGPAAGPGFPSTSKMIRQLFGKGGVFEYLAHFNAPLDFNVTDLPASARQRVLLEEGGLRITASAGHHYNVPAIMYRIDYKGRSMTFSGDFDSNSHVALRALAQNTKLLACNAVVLDPPGSPALLYQLHTAPRDIGEIARDVRPEQLLLAHLNPVMDSAKEQVLASIAKAWSGPVIFAEDRMHLR